MRARARLCYALATVVTRRKLYMMALTMVVPYCPMQMIFLFNDIRLGLPWTKPYDLGQLHAPGWDRLDYAPSTSVSFTSMYINYIAVLEVVVFFIYFGRTKEAHEMYRGYLRTLGLGRIFPSLNGEWRPLDRSSTTFKTLWSRAKSASSSFARTRGSLTYVLCIRRIRRPLPERLTSNDMPWYSSSNNTRDSLAKQHLVYDEDSQVFDMRLRSLDLEAARMGPNDTLLALNKPQLPHRQPWLFRTTFQLPRVPVPAFFAASRGVVDDTPSQNSLGSMVALLGGSPRFAISSNDDDVAKVNVSRETVHNFHWSSVDLSNTRTGLNGQGDVACSQMSQVEKRYPSFLASAYVPKRAVAGSHGACRLFFFPPPPLLLPCHLTWAQKLTYIAGGCEEDSPSHAAQHARQQRAAFERGLISIRRDFANKD